MIEEDYVSFETAKLLKEKGFDERISTVYKSYGELRRLKRYYGICNSDYNDITKNYFEFTAPTLQMVMEWLRKVHNIHIAIVPCEVGPGVMDYTYILYKIDAKNFIFKDLEIQGRANTDKMSAPKTCEAAIKYCLENLI